VSRFPSHEPSPNHIYTLSLHDALPISSNNGYTGSATANWQAAYATLGVGYNYDRDQHDVNWQLSGGVVGHENGITLSQPLGDTRSEEHTSELQSRFDLVCRLLLEKKKT